MIRAREEQGFVLVTAIVLLTVILGLGLGLLLFTDNQQAASTREQGGEASFNLAEAALNAQILQLAREWPGKPGAEGGSPVQPTSCASGSETSLSNFCPDHASLEKAYPNTGAACPAGTQGDAWGSPLTNKWTTYVREQWNGSPYFNSTEEKTLNNFDEGPLEGGKHKPYKKIWVRAVGVVNCHTSVVVSLVAEQLVHANFPESALSANWFATGNEGSKVILNHEGKEGSLAGKFTIRCEPPRTETNCEEYRKGQIVPPLTEEEQKPSPTPSTTLSAEQLEELKAQAKSEGHFYSGASCPGNKELEKLSGKPTYVEGCGGLKFTGGVANSATQRGFLILANGSIELDGGALFYGVVYDANLQKSSETLVTIKGGAKVIGAIVVDGSGGISLGDKGNETVAFEYDPTVIHEFEIFTGAAGTRNGFRILPAGQ
jgi:hypothetical protein